jgi:lambda repressor-like predicted transcriptional regulator
LRAQGELGRTEVVGAEIRRLHFVRGLSIRESSRRTGLDRDTIRRAISSDEPPAYSRVAKGSKLDPFKPEIQRLLRADPALGGQGVLRCRASPEAQAVREAEGCRVQRARYGAALEEADLIAARPAVTSEVSLQ